MPVALCPAALDKGVVKPEVEFLDMPRWRAMTASAACWSNEEWSCDATNTAIPQQTCGNSLSKYEVHTVLPRVLLRVDLVTCSRR
jgi:hypothetical protein